MKKVILYIIFALIITITVGFIRFYLKIQYKEVNFNKLSDGVAVLTGGKGRIQLGLETIRMNENVKLIISGVDKKVSMESIIPSYFQNKQNIFLDKNSESTFQNALVISEWISKHNLKNITIITSYYHIPRSMLLLKTLSPDSKFYPYPVIKKNFNKPSRKEGLSYYLFLTEEYIKYLLSHIIIFV